MKQRLTITDVQYIGGANNPPDECLHRLIIARRLFVWMGFIDETRVPKAGDPVIVDWELGEDGKPVGLSVWFPAYANMSPFHFTLGHRALLAPKGAPKTNA